MRRRRRKSPPGTPFSVDIDKLSHEGRGIAHLDGKVVFVEGALPGEKVEAVYTSRRDSFDEARLHGILRSSPARIEPPCEFAAVCGGCSLQHFDPREQLAFKQDMLFEKLQHAVPGQAFERFEAITGPVLGYRRKARLAVRYVHKKNRVLVGFREKHSTFITLMDSCKVLDPRLACLLPALSTLIGALDGFRHIPQIEAAAGDPGEEEETVALVFRHLQPLSDADLEKLAQFARDRGISLYLQPGGNDSVHKLSPAAGEDRLYYRLPEFSLRLAFHPMDFTQVNGDINRKMISRAIGLLELRRDDVVLDLFCGLGNFTLPVAGQCRSVTGIEGSREMVARAGENAARNVVVNADFHCADLSGSMAGEAWMQNGFSKVLVDPPRSGAIEILPDVVGARPERIVYVSCNPATLARDTEFLCRHGYRLARAGVMDMFPQTTHVESMALFLPMAK